MEKYFQMYVYQNGCMYSISEYTNTVKEKLNLTNKTLCTMTLGKRICLLKLADKNGLAKNKLARLSLALFIDQLEITIQKVLLR